MLLADVSFDVEFPPDLLRLDELMMGEFKTAAEQTALLTSDRVRHNIVQMGIDAGHALLNSVDWDVNEDGYDLIAEVFSLEQHALWIEEGRGPGPVPVAPIIEWMMDKGISPREGETLEQAAHAIANHIAREGYEGRHPFQLALDEAESIAIAAIDRALMRINRRLAL
jgi:hypothetical protein